jgi:predicted nucleic acid-binding protein
MAAYLADKSALMRIGLNGLIAAVAERHALTLVHYDSDFDHVVEVTGQATRWLAPRGTW